MSTAEQQVLFEPWNMGDALIAAAIAIQLPDAALACNSRWHSLIEVAADGLHKPTLIPLDLEYVNRGRKGRMSSARQPTIRGNRRVLSIRGDPRDYLAARGMFPESIFRSSGWYEFAARRSWLLDLPYAKGLRPVRNRYRAWAKLADVPWSQIESFYNQKRVPPAEPLATIHIGAQWRSRQYPHVADLAELLSRTIAVQLIGGPGDPLPDGVVETDVLRLKDRELVNAFRASSLIVSNDSGPMHLAALLRCRVVVLSRVACIEEWLPPATESVVSQSAPRGYRPSRSYMSDRVVEGWPTVDEIVSKINFGLK